MAERKAMLELAIDRALICCKSRKGYEILISYLEDKRALLARSAHNYLCRKTRKNYDKNVKPWFDWLKHNF